MFTKSFVKMGRRHLSRNCRFYCSAKIKNVWTWELNWQNINKWYLWDALHWISMLYIWQHDILTWKSIPHYCWPLVTGVVPLTKGPVRQSSGDFFIAAWTSFWTNGLDTGDLRPCDAHVMSIKWISAHWSYSYIWNGYDHCLFQIQDYHHCPLMSYTVKPLI